MALPGSPGDVTEEAAWRERIDAAPALVYLLACHRQGAYTVGAASGREAIASRRAQMIAAQPTGQRQWPALVWLQTTPSPARAEFRARSLRRWPHARQRALVERANPDWVDLDDLLYHRPTSSRRPLPETGPPDHRTCDSIGSRAREAHTAEAEAARQAILELAARAEWTGAEAGWWYTRVKAAPWLVSVFACARSRACRIEVTPGRVLEPACARLFAYNRPHTPATALPRWRWVWLEPHAEEGEARARAEALRRMPLPWIARLVSAHNPDWHALESLMAGCGECGRKAASLSMR